jgi:hypothetical protein
MKYDRICCEVEVSGSVSLHQISDQTDCLSAFVFTFSQNLPLSVSMGFFVVITALTYFIHCT